METEKKLDSLNKYMRNKVSQKIIEKDNLPTIRPSQISWNNSHTQLNLKEVDENCLFLTLYVCCRVIRKTQNKPVT